MPTPVIPAFLIAHLTSETDASFGILEILELRFSKATACGKAGVDLLAHGGNVGAKARRAPLASGPSVRDASAPLRCAQHDNPRPLPRPDSTLTLALSPCRERGAGNLPRDSSTPQRSARHDKSGGMDKVCNAGCNLNILSPALRVNRMPGLSVLSALRWRPAGHGLLPA